MDPNVPGSSNRPAAADLFARNPDGTVPDHAIVPVDPSHVASVQPKPDAPVDDAKHAAHAEHAQNEPQL